MIDEHTNDEIPEMSWMPIPDLFDGDESHRAFWDESFPLVEDVIADTESKLHLIDEAGVALMKEFIEQIRPYCGQRLAMIVPDGYSFKWTLDKKYA